ncbi:MAG: peptide chain release factor N(5)-glutamine methyltransferase [Oscillospiraceae bacterium]|nr:peptide chain release factor N(5)-glutamine methyltransferase [Oscillospiraceae bacterium]
MVNSEFVRMLEDAGIPDADFDVRCMTEQITGNRFAPELHPEQRNQMLDMVQRRMQGEPLQYILGEWEFYGLRIFVGKGVLIPRPDTEILVDTVLDWCKGKSGLKVLDLCTGSGCIALALKKHLPDADVSAVDTSETALTYARKNAEYHHLDIEIHHADVLDKHFAKQFHDYDVIVSNPPYLTGQEMQELQTEVRHEPAIALLGGSDEDGTYFYRKITSIWKDAIKTGGLLAYEIGWKQAERVSELLNSHAFRQIQVIQDYEQRDRVVTGEKI